MGANRWMACGAQGAWLGVPGSHAGSPCLGLCSCVWMLGAWVIATGFLGKVALSWLSGDQKWRWRGLLARALWVKAALPPPIPEQDWLCGIHVPVAVPRQF